MRVSISFFFNRNLFFFLVERFQYLKYLKRKLASIPVLVCVGLFFNSINSCIANQLSSFIIFCIWPKPSCNPSLDTQKQESSRQLYLFLIERVQILPFFVSKGLSLRSMCLRENIKENVKK